MKLRLTKVQPDDKNLFGQKVAILGVIVKNTKLGLKVSKDILDDLLDGKDTVIEIEDTEKADNFAQELKDLGVSVEFE